MNPGDRRIDKGFRLSATTESRVEGKLGRLNVGASVLSRVVTRGNGKPKRSWRLKDGT